MQLRLLVCILFLPIAAVLAGGYSGALERVWLFYAYQIDGFNDEAKRTLGVKCKSRDPEENKCRKNNKGQTQWQPCKGVLPNRRCGFSDLLNTLGGVSPKDELFADKDENLLSDQETNPDPEETAKNVWNHYQTATTPNVPDYMPNKYIKDGDKDYVKCITHVGDVVAKAITDGKKTTDNEWLFDRFNECTEQIRFAREGDHGLYLIEEAEAKLPSEINVETKDVGPGRNPLDPARKWKTVDWETTMEVAAASSNYNMAQLEAMMQDAYADVDAKAKGC